MTTSGPTPAGACDTPLDPEVLVDYWLGLLTPEAEDHAEQHLFACDACGDRLRQIMDLSDALRTLAQSGGLKVVVSEVLVARAAQSGRRVRQYDLAPGQTVPCTIAADDDLLVARLAADLTGVGRVDLSFCDPQGVERQRMADIPVQADTGRVILQESVTFAKASPSTTMVARMLAVGASGEERLLGEYTFQHTRTIPGPPGWEW